MVLNIPFLAELLLKVYNLVIGISGPDNDVTAVFKSLVEFFGGTFA